MNQGCWFKNKTKYRNIEYNYNTQAYIQYVMIFVFRQNQ